MKIFFGKLFVAVTIIFFVTSVQAAAQGIQSGGKGSTEISAIEDMKISAVKRALAHLTERSDDVDSPYRKLLSEYKNFVGAIHIDKRGKNSAGVFVIGTVEIKYSELQAAFGQLVKDSHGGDFTREVYVFVRFVGNVTEEQRRSAENVILQRYLTRLRENKFVVADADEIIGELNLTRAMTFDQFVDFVKRKSIDSPEICTAVIGEVRLNQNSADIDGFTATCEMTIRVLDCLHDFAPIDIFDGNEILRMKNSDRIKNFLCEKAAVTSSKSVTDSLVRYWAEKF